MKPTETQTPAATAKPEITIKLTRPLERGEQVISTLVLREPRAINLKGMKLADVLQLDVDSILTLTQRIATPPLTDIEVRWLAPSDITRIGVAVIDFFADRPTDPDEADRS